MDYQLRDILDDTPRDPLTRDGAEPEAPRDPAHDSPLFDAYSRAVMGAVDTVAPAS